MAEVGALRITLGLDSIDFTQGLQNVNRRITALNSEFRAISTGAARFDNSLDTLRARSDVLSRTMSTHRTKVEELRRQYEQSKAATGENSDETLRLATAYNRAVAAMSSTENQLRNVNAQIQNHGFKEFEEEVNNSVDSITRQMRVMESQFDAATAGIENFGESTDDLRQREENLSRSLSLHQQRVQELTRLHEESAREKGRDAQETQEIEIRLNRATQAMRETEAQLNSTTAEIREQTNVWSNLSTRVGDTGRRLDEQGAKLRGIGQNLMSTVTLPLAGFGLAAGKIANDFDSSAGRIEARLGVTADRAEELGDIAREVWEKNWGENIQDVGDGITTISKNLKDITDDELRRAGEAAYFLANAFDADLNESTRAAGQLMKDFGDDSDKAFDIITWGFQNGLDYTGEFLDTIREYSPQFSEMGYTSEKMLSTLKKGFDAGSWSLDKLGDSIKESHLRMGDLSKATIDAYKAMGLNAEEYVAKINKGGKEGNKAFQDIVKKLMEVDDATERNALSVALFGTQYEDLREKIIFAMADAEDSIDGLEGTTKRAADAIQDNFGDRATKVWREFISDLEPVGEKLLDIGEEILPKVADTVEDVTDAFADMSPEGQNTALAIGAVALAAGPAIGLVGSLASGVGILAMGLSPLIASLGTAGLAGGLTALAGPVGLTVAGLGLATGAVVGLSKAFGDAKEVNLEHTNALIEDQLALEDSVAQYEELRGKMTLSNNEFGRYLDLQDKIKMTTDPKAIETYKSAMADLQEKSGLTVEELEKFVGLDEDIRENAPDTVQKVSEYGNAFIDLSSSLDPIIGKQREFITNQLQIEKDQAYENLKTAAEEVLDTQEKLNTSIERHNEKMLEQEGYRRKAADLQIEINKAEADGDTARAEHFKREQSAYSEKATNLDSEIKRLYEGFTIEQERLNNLYSQVAEGSKVYDQLVQQELKMVGINGKSSEALNLIDEKIKKLQGEKSALDTNYKTGALTTAEYQEQNQKINSQIERLRDSHGRVEDIQGEQKKVTGEIQTQIEKGQKVNEILTKDTVKNVKIDDNGGTAKVQREAEKGANKNIKVDDNGGNKRIQQDAEKSANKTVNTKLKRENSIWDLIPKTVSVAVSFLGKLNGFATGTKDAPGGLAMVGEAGRELTYFPNRPGLALVNGPSLLDLPKGAKVIPNADTEAILRKWNIPAMAKGGVALSPGMAYVGERGRELLDLTGARTGPLSNSPAAASSFVINPAPIILDGVEIGKVDFDLIESEMGWRYTQGMITQGLKP
ncbi:phage tail tape measure protein [Bacillus sp. AG4(2022)]|uniref:phage tail tape measure protein n=1 Tax=Bacillus sp. AG4(2022) TaxID=2962594 RepID=UPI0028827402|nr:phage tail tape measure protein [Bacillus sp. AG4(2022)]MDT0163817.1 phage tail tape measure protein [Bacillus sp. AG4(2022)]